MSKNREENENIQLSYAIVLANLIRTQEIEKAERMLGELKNLTQRIENVEIILAYVKSIVVLCKKRDISIKKRNKMFREFCSTCEQYSKYDEIIMFYRTIMSYLTFPSKN